MQPEQQIFNKRLALIITVLLLILAVPIGFRVSRLGETAVKINVVPDTSQVYLNGQLEEGRKVYLKPGRYTFEAKHEGFKNDTQSVTVGRDTVEVGLIPEPDSEDALSLLERDPQLQQAREAIGGQRAQKKGEALRAKTPIIDLLPYIDEAGPFSIDYGPSQTRDGGTFILISDSSPEGRVNALRWIRQQGYDPTDLEIRFDDFQNPLAPVGQGVSNE